MIPDNDRRIAAISKPSDALTGNRFLGAGPDEIRRGQEDRENINSLYDSPPQAQTGDFFEGLGRGLRNFIESLNERSDDGSLTIGNRMNVALGGDNAVIRQRPGRWPEFEARYGEMPKTIGDLMEASRLAELGAETDASIRSDAAKADLEQGIQTADKRFQIDYKEKIADLNKQLAAAQASGEQEASMETMNQDPSIHTAGPLQRNTDLDEERLGVQREALDVETAELDMQFSRDLQQSRAETINNILLPALTGNQKTAISDDGTQSSEARESIDVNQGLNVIKRLIAELEQRGDFFTEEWQPTSLRIKAEDMVTADDKAGIFDLAVALASNSSDILDNARKMHPVTEGQRQILQNFMEEGNRFRRDLINNLEKNEEGSAYLQELSGIVTTDDASLNPRTGFFSRVFNPRDSVSRQMGNNDIVETVTGIPLEEYRQMITPEGYEPLNIGNNEYAIGAALMRIKDLMDEGHLDRARLNTDFRNMGIDADGNRNTIEDFDRLLRMYTAKFDPESTDSWPVLSGKERRDIWEYFTENLRNTLEQYNRGR